MRKWFNWLLGKPCEHDFFITSSYVTSYVDGERWVQVFYKRYVLRCKKCGKRREVDALKYEKEQTDKAQRQWVMERQKIQIKNMERIRKKKEEWKKQNEEMKERYIRSNME